MIIFYTLLIGASSPVDRDAITGAVDRFGPLPGRRQVGVNNLAGDRVELTTGLP